MTWRALRRGDGEADPRRRASGAGRAGRASSEERAARADLERIGSGPAVHRPPGERPLPTGTDCVFRLEGDTRRIVFADRAVLLHDRKGMRYLARLLAVPDREFHVLDLVRSELHAARREVGGEVGPVLDAQARAAYQRRLAEIDEDIDEAAALGDADRVVLANADRDHLVRELAGAFGIGSRPRLPGSTSERAPASVTPSLRYAIARIATHHPAMAAHLERTIQTGTYCSYAPDPRVPPDGRSGLCLPSGRRAGRRPGDVRDEVAGHVARLAVDERRRCRWGRRGLRGRRGRRDRDRWARERCRPGGGRRRRPARRLLRRRLAGG